MWTCGSRAAGGDAEGWPAGALGRVAAPLRQYARTQEVDPGRLDERQRHCARTPGSQELSY